MVCNMYARGAYKTVRCIILSIFSVSLYSNSYSSRAIAIFKCKQSFPFCIKNRFAASLAFFEILFQVSMILHDRTVLQTKDETFALWTLYRYGYRSTLCGTICDYSWLALPLAGYVVMIWGCYIAYAARLNLLTLETGRTTSTCRAF